MTIKTPTQEWITRRERGSLNLLTHSVQIALWMGRPVSRILLYPICLYFLISSPAATRSSYQYLARVLGRPPRVRDVFRHFLTFASCVLDRVFLLNERCDEYDIHVQGEDIVREIAETGGGCILVGAHFGSFEVTRAIGRQQPDVQISLLMYEENAKKIRAALAAINPRLETEVIGLGPLDSLITVAERLFAGHFIGVLADRSVNGKNLAQYNFLGSMAAFPTGPFKIAMLLHAPVVLMIGVYRGGRRYDVIFERIAKPAPSERHDGALWMDRTMRQYVDRLEHYCRDAPFNWFNFFNFWD
ncbi:MAG: hypothetical protein POH28_07635 [Acidocella sp.]|nr:hypothetical protein [Acidocella sp.]